MIICLTYACLDKSSEVLDQRFQISKAVESNDFLLKSINIKGDYNAILEFDYDECKELLAYNVTYYEGKAVSKKIQSIFEYDEDRNLKKLHVSDVTDYENKAPLIGYQSILEYNKDLKGLHIRNSRVNPSATLEWDTTDLQYVAKSTGDTSFFNSYDNIIYQYKDDKKGARIISAKYFKSNDLQRNLERNYFYNTPLYQYPYLSEISRIESGNMQTINAISTSPKGCENPLFYFSKLIPMLIDVNMGTESFNGSSFYGIPCIMSTSHFYHKKQVFNVTQREKYPYYDRVLDTVIIEVLSYKHSKSGYTFYPTDIRITHAGQGYGKSDYNKSYIAHFEYQ